MEGWAVPLKERAGTLRSGIQGKWPRDSWWGVGVGLGVSRAWSTKAKFQA